MKRYVTKLEGGLLRRRKESCGTAKEGAGEGNDAVNISKVCRLERERKGGPV